MQGLLVLSIVTGVLATTLVLMAVIKVMKK